MLTNLRLADLRLTAAQQRYTGQNLPSDLYLEDSLSFHPVFKSLDFATIIFLQSKVISSAGNPHPVGPDFRIHVSQ
jgi:hypothetical protein